MTAQHAWSAGHTPSTTPCAHNHAAASLCTTPLRSCMPPPSVRTTQALASAPPPRAGYKMDEYTLLKETKERMLASSVTTTWKYSSELDDYQEAFENAKAAIAGQFFGPPAGGVYSPSVQFTLFNMGKAAIEAVQAIESVYLYMPNIHFLPCNPVNSAPFADDVYVATSEPFGTIETTITRGKIKPHKQL
jgi:urate oxidase